MTRRLQFSVRAILLLMFVVSLPLAWLAYEEARLRRATWRVSAIQRLGGQMDAHFGTTEEGATDGVYDKTPCYLIAVRLPNCAVSDGDLAIIEPLTSLKDLDLSNTAITDAGLPRLKRLTKLRRLNLTGTRVTDAAVRVLQQRLPQCRIDR